MAKFISLYILKTKDGTIKRMYGMLICYVGEGLRKAFPLVSENLTFS